VTTINLATRESFQSCQYARARAVPRQDAADTPKVFASKQPPLQQSMSQRGDDVFNNVFREARDRQERIHFERGPE
jgi:hypothetical protein